MKHRPRKSRTHPKSKVVTTRKPHTCARCKEERPAGSRMLLEYTRTPVYEPNAGLYHGTDIYDEGDPKQVGVAYSRAYYCHFDHPGCSCVAPHSQTVTINCPDDQAARIKEALHSIVPGDETEDNRMMICEDVNGCIYCFHLTRPAGSNEPYQATPADAETTKQAAEYYREFKSGRRGR